MSVARNLWRVADAPHIVPADSVERQTAERLINACPAERLINACPAGLFRSHRKVTYVLTIAVAWSVAPAVCCATNQHYNSGAIRLPDSASPTALDK